MPYKIFRQGEPPSQRDLQMLMDQSVIVCTSTSRPFAPHEGMFIYETDSNGFKWYNGTTWVALGSAIDGWISGSNLSVPGNLSAGGALTATGAATVASLDSANDVTMRGSIVNRLVDGRTGGASTITTIGASTDTNIIGANVQNVSVVAGRAYLAHIQLDFHATGTLGQSRLDLKLWKNAVGGTQLGNTVRWMTGTPISTGLNSTIGFRFIWNASSTEVIANVNLSASKTNNTANGWEAEVNGAYIATIEEFGAASVVTGL